MNKTMSAKEKIKAIKCCPSCGSKDLYRMEVDLLCLDCSWLSASLFVSMGGMDNIFSAARDHFGSKDEADLAVVASESHEGVGAA